MVKCIIVIVLDISKILRKSGAIDMTNLYRVTITETLEVEADNKQEAEEKAYELSQETADPKYIVKLIEKNIDGDEE